MRGRSLLLPSSAGEVSASYADGGVMVFRTASVCDAVYRVADARGPEEHERHVGGGYSALSGALPAHDAFRPYNHRL